MFYTVVSVLSKLSGEVVEADIVATFKRHLARHMNRHGMEGY